MNVFCWDYVLNIFLRASKQYAAESHIGKN